MSSFNANFKQILLILDRLQSVPFTSKKEFIAILESYDFENSDRTFDRKIQLLRTEFGLEIKHYPRKGYKLEPTDEEGRKYLELMNTAYRSTFLLETVKDAKSLLKIIDFEKAENQQVNQLLLDVITAIRNKYPIKIEYKTFASSESHERIVHPYVLKQYSGRWYVIGEKQDDDKEIRTYALDRIRSLKKIVKPFKGDRSKEIYKNLSTIIGVNYSISKVERVLVRLSAFQTKYLETLPLHLTQREVNRTENYTDFEFMLVPNYEFQQRIIMLGSEAEVLEPKWLRETFKKRIALMAESYRD